MNRRSNRAELVFLFAVMAAGAFLRFYRIGKECLWFDEIVVIGYASNSLSGIVEDLVFELGMLFPPLYFFAIRIWVSLVGLGPVALRSFSALWGIAAIPIIYLLAREMFGRKAAVVSTVLLTFSAFNIYYSQEAKMYAMWWTLVLASNLFFVRAVKYGCRWPDISLYVAATAAALLTHNFPALVILSQVIYLIAVSRQRERAGRWILAYALVALLCCPWVFYLLARNLTAQRGAGMEGAMELARKGFEWIPKPTLKALFNSFIIFASGMKLYAYDLDTWSAAWHSPFHCAGRLCGLVLVMLLYPIFRARPDKFRFPWFLAILILFPSVSVFLYSRFVRPLWHPRYLGFVSSLIFIAIGYGYRLSDRKLIYGTAVGILLALNISVLNFYYSDRVKMGWDDLVVYLSPRVGSGTSVLFPYVEMKTSLEYYWNLDEKRREVPLNFECPYDASGKIKARVADFKDVWMVQSYSMPRSRRRPPKTVVEVPGYRHERMLFANGLEAVHYVRERADRDAAEEK